jgi:hypothetical protein
MVSSFIRIFLLLLACSIILLLTYTEQLAEANEYMGMQSWVMSGLGYFLYLISLPIIAYIFTKFRGIPSDFLLHNCYIILFDISYSYRAINSKYHYFWMVYFICAIDFNPSMAKITSFSKI